MFDIDHGLQPGAYTLVHELHVHIQPTTPSLHAIINNENFTGPACDLRTASSPPPPGLGVQVGSTANMQKCPPSFRYFSVMTCRNKPMRFIVVNYCRSCAVTARNARSVKITFNRFSFQLSFVISFLEFLNEIEFQMGNVFCT